METIDRAHKPPLGEVPTAHDVNPSSNKRTVGARRKRVPPKAGRRRKAKAAVTISPGGTSTRDVWLDKA